MDRLSVEVLDQVLAENSKFITRQSESSSNAQVILPTTTDLLQPLPCPDRLFCYYISSSMTLSHVTPLIHQDFQVALDEAINQGRPVELLQSLQSVPIHVGLFEPAPMSLTDAPISLTEAPISPTDAPISPTETPNSLTETPTETISDQAISVSERSDGDEGLQTPGIILLALGGVTLLVIVMFVQARRNGQITEPNGHKKLQGDGGDLITQDEMNPEMSPTASGARNETASESPASAVNDHVPTPPSPEGTATYDGVNYGGDLENPDEANPEMPSTPTDAGKETASESPASVFVEHAPAPRSPRGTVTDNGVNYRSLQSPSSISSGSEPSAYDGVQYGETFYYGESLDRPYSRPAPNDPSKIKVPVVYDGVNYSEEDDDYSEGDVVLHDLGEDWVDPGLGSDSGPRGDDDDDDTLVFGDISDDDDLESGLATPTPNYDNALESGLATPTPNYDNDDKEIDPNTPSGWGIRNRQDLLRTLSEVSGFSSHASK